MHSLEDPSSPPHNGCHSQSLGPSVKSDVNFNGTVFLVNVTIIVPGKEERVSKTIKGKGKKKEEEKMMMKEEHEKEGREEEEERGEG